MRIKRSELGASRPELRPGLEEEVRAILEEVRREGDLAVRRLGERFDGVDPGSLRVDPAEVEASAELVEPRRPRRSTNRCGERARAGGGAAA